MFVCVCGRYYVAEGVRLYSQESWRLLTGSRGVELVEKNISHVVSSTALCAPTMGLLPHTHTHTHIYPCIA